MSAIAGLAANVAGSARQQGVREALAAMSSRLRGPPNIWSDQAVVLGGCAAALAPTRDDRLFAISADARLYNRAELLEQVRCSSALSDAELIVAAYEAWGEECATRLLGDFAFALWDRRRQALFCARDHFGVRPFVYAEIPAGFCFASESQAVRVISGAATIDRQRIADYVAGLAPDDQTTWFVGVQRLPAGHTLLFERGRAQLRCYWRPQATTPSRADASEEFRHRLSASVKVRTSEDSGVLLSGGLDSSTVALLAVRTRPKLPTFSLVFDDPGLRDERRYIDDALRCGEFAPTFIDASHTGALDDFDAVLTEHDGPILAPGIATSRQLCRAAANAGVASILDGHGGDEVVSHGFARLSELARAGDWSRVWRNARAESDLYGARHLDVFLAYWVHLGPLRSLFGAANRLRSRGARMVGAAASPPAWRRWLDPAFARESGIDERWRKARAERVGHNTEAAHHVAALGAPIRAHALEVLDRVAAHAGLEARYPFFDKGLVEFSLSLSAAQKLDDGWGRLILRKAMEGVLPPSIQWRRDKFDFTPSLAQTLITRHKAMLDEIILGGAGDLDGIVDKNALRATYRSVAAASGNAKGADVHALWRCAALALWLRKRPGQRRAMPHTLDAQT